MTLENRDGLGLVETIILISVLGTVSWGLTSLLLTNLYFAKHIEIKGDLDQLRQWVRNSMSCEKTVLENSAPRRYVTACHEGTGALPIVGENGLPLFEENRHVGQHYYLRATCPRTELGTCGGTNGVPCGRVPKIEVMRSGVSSAVPSLDPMTKREHAWTDLFRGLPSPCSTNDGERALAFQPSVSTGTYLGQPGSVEQTVPLGFRPKLLIITRGLRQRERSAIFYKQDTYSGPSESLALVMRSGPMELEAGSYIRIVDDGFEVTGVTNEADFIYHYAAFH